MSKKKVGSSFKSRSELVLAEVGHRREDENSEELRKKNEVNKIKTPFANALSSTNTGPRDVRP